MQKFPRMIMLGAAGRNKGKTELACALIAAFKEMPLAKPAVVYALKVTAVEASCGPCPRGGKGCGACDLGGASFVLSEEQSVGGDKDTARLLAAGAKKVFWLRSLRSHLKEGFAAFSAALPKDALVICESNALREVVEPALFVMIEGENAKREAKPSAAKVAHFADIRFDNPREFQALEMCLERLPAYFLEQDG